MKVSKTTLFVMWGVNIINGATAVNLGDALYKYTPATNPFNVSTKKDYIFSCTVFALAFPIVGNMALAYQLKGATS